jgi:diguanylate cyclase (GGDEF)-like protein
MFALALLAFGAVVARRHYYIGMGAIAIAGLVYGLRAIVLQGHYLQTQQALKKAQARLEEMALVDGLTGIANRRSFDQRLKMEWSLGARMHHPLSLLMIDVDHFKNLNDTFGHQAGDDCLIAVAAALKSALPRNTDLLARYGGEEFVALLAGTGTEGAEVVAARMREAVEALKIVNETAVGRTLSISVGIATYDDPRAGSGPALIDGADRALYKAKQAGRNRTETLPIVP